MSRSGIVLAVALSAVWSGAVFSAPGPAASGGAAAAGRYADGAPPGFSGGFGEQSCHACHFSAEPNTAPGRLSIVGVPDVYAAGEVYAVTITLERPGLRAGGFQLTGRFRDGGAQAGSLSAPSAESERVKIDQSSSVQYAAQRKAGAAPVAAGTARWTLNWTAPATGGVVVFHAAANAADGDESASGDFVHTAVQESAAQQP